MGTTQRIDVHITECISACGSRLRLWVVLFCLFPVATGCKPQPVLTTQLLRGETMGTTYSIKLVPTGSTAVKGQTLSDLAKAVQAELDQVNAEMSTYIDDSEISRFNSSGEVGEWFEVSSHTAEVVSLAGEISSATEGSFDVTVGPLVNLWGFGPDGRPTSIPSDEAVREKLGAVGFQKVQVRLNPPALKKDNPATQIDLSAIAKGHGVDRVAKLLDQAGVTDYFIEIGGEVRVRGARADGRPWRVGIESPNESMREVRAVLEVRDRAVASSGNYRNYYESDGVRFSHTIDPKTGRPTIYSIASATVVANNCALADGVATSMMSMGAEAGLAVANENGWEVLLTTVENERETVYASDAFQEAFPDVPTGLVSSGVSEEKVLSD